MARIFTEAWLAERTRKQAQRIGSPVTRPELANVEFVSLSGGVDGHALKVGGKNHSTVRVLPKVQNRDAVPSGGTESANGNGCRSEAGIKPGPLTLQCREGGAAKQPAHTRAMARAATSSAAPLRPLERDVLAGVLQALKLHPLVSWAHRFNVGGMRDSYGNNVRFGFVGCSDILGQMRNGRFLAVEVKRPGGQPTQAQVEFLGMVERSGGVAFIARDIDDVGRALAPTRGVA